MNKPIPDVGGTNALIDVPEDGLVITDVNVVVNVHHTRDSDLVLKLYSQVDGAVVGDRHHGTLFNHYGGTGDNVLGAIFDDSAATPIASGAAPFTGEFKPDEPLSMFNGDVGGQWRLTAGDDTSGETGYISDWSITFTYATCDFDADGVEDHADTCVGTHGAAPTGCALAPRALTAKYRSGAFRGVLSSSVTACHGGRSVTVWKVHRGPDRKIKTVTTSSDGKYRFARAKRAGRYYATAAPTSLPGVAECAAVKSATFRVH